MANCKQYTEQLSALVDGELSEQQIAELASHLETCPDCRRVYDAFLALSGAMSDDLAAPPEEFSKGVMFKISTAEKAKKKNRRQVFSWLAAAACLALIIFGAVQGGFFGLFRAGSSAPKSASLSDAPADNENIKQAPNIDINLELPESYSTFTGTGGDSADGENGEEAPTGGIMLFDEQKGLLNSDFTSNEAFLESEMNRLLTAEKIALYEGEFFPDNAEYAAVIPTFETFDEKDLEKLFVLMRAELLLAYDDKTADGLEPYCTLVFARVKTADDQGAEDVAVTVWVYDSQLIFRIGGETPILFLARAFPLDFEEYVVQLTKK